MPKKVKPARRKRTVQRAPRRRRATASRGRSLETALAEFAHDVRTPLTGILALSELLSVSELPERERGWAQTIKSTAEHLTLLTSLIVDAVRKEAKGLVLRQELMRPRQLADALGASLAARAEAKGLTAELAIADDLPLAAMSDLPRLRAALENIIDNAIKFTERGRVRFGVTSKRIARNRAGLTFTVTDSGIGLTAGDIKRLFRPFAQASDRIAHQFGGAGLGLAFAKRIAKAMGGDLTVASKPGGGSRFRLTVTVDLPAPADDASASGAFQSRAAPSLAILCAEDNPYGRVVLNTILVELGHRVDFVSTGDAAVEASKRGRYDLILMDVTLPGIDGLEAARRIRALDAPTGQIPIVGISGRAHAGDEAAGRAAGMDAYLIKPLSPSTLVPVLASLTSRG